MRSTAEHREAETAIAHHGLVRRAGRYGTPEWFSSFDRQEAALAALIAAALAAQDAAARWADDGGRAP